MQAQAQHLGPMIEIPGYRVIKELGQGGMASVYLAEQVSLERMVALKVMSAKLADDPTFTTRFLREARIAARLAHPNIITVHEVGVHGSQHYICMEHHEGGDLKDLIEAGLPQDQGLLIAREIISALAFAHDAGFIHRDVKPANVLFRHDGSAVLMDFGIAKATDGENKLTQVGSILGTPYYISPEQVSAREPDARSDLYSAGIMLFEMLTGARPYDGDTAIAIMFAHVSRPVPQLPEHLQEYQFLIDGLLAKEPDDRYQSGYDALGDIDALLPNNRTGVRTGVRSPTNPVTGRSGATGVGSGATGVGSGATGVRSGATGVRSGATGVRSGATGVRAGGTGVRGPNTGGTTRRPLSDRPITQPSPPPVEMRRDYQGQDDGLTLTVGRGDTTHTPAGDATHAPSGAGTTAPAGVADPALTHADAATMLAPESTGQGAAPTAQAPAPRDDRTLTVALGARPDVTTPDAGTLLSLETVAAQPQSPQKVGAARKTEAATRLKTEFMPVDGRVIKGRFKLMRLLGKGGMGSVYKAIDLLKQEAGDATPFVAVKLLNDNISQMPNALRIMQRETKQSQELSHPNIIKVFDFDRDDAGSLYMTMELLEGQPLDSALSSGATDKLSLADRCRAIEEMSAGLAYAHKNNVVHCDFKPGNVFLLSDGSAKVLDFGIARVAQGATGAASGDTLFGYTPRYASSEIMQMAPAHPADDVYALAAVAYELLSGKHPFDGRNIVEAQRNGMKPERLPQLKRHQWDAIVHGLAFAKEARLQTAQAFLEEFHGKPNWLLYGGIAALLAIVIGAGAWYGGLATADPEDQIAPAQRAQATEAVNEASNYLTAHYARGRPNAYPQAMERFGDALKANPYNRAALTTLETEAHKLLDATPATVADKQNLESMLQSLLSIEKVPMRDELISKLEKLQNS